MQNNKKNKKNTKNTAKEVANFLGTRRSAIDCFSVRAKKTERKSIMPQRLLIYRILVNCDLESIAPYKDDSNFKEKGIYAVAKLPNIKALNPLEKESKKDKHHSLD